MKKEELAISVITVILSVLAVIFLDYNVYQEVFVASGVSLSFWGIVLLVLFTGPATVIAVKLLSLVIALPFVISAKLIWIAIGVLIFDAILKATEKSMKS